MKKPVPPIPQTRLSIDVEFKALPSPPVQPSPSPEGTIGEKIIAPVYHEEQHETWRLLCERQSKLITQKACPEYLAGKELLNVSTNRIPNLADLSRSLMKTTGWQVIRVDGFVDPVLFFTLLANRCFPCTDFIRHTKELDYTPAPDMFHDIMGHLPLITNPRYASFFHSFGVAGANTQTDEERLWFARVYWFTVEFGLINAQIHNPAKFQKNETQLYGAGTLSSLAEIEHALKDNVEKIPFDMELMTQTDYDIHHLQDRVFVISCFEELEEKFYKWAISKNLL
jgi:phenylalanine-4-hydroxylase